MSCERALTWLETAYCELNCELEILFPIAVKLRWWGMQSDNSVDYEAENVWNVLGESEIEKHLTDKLYRTNASTGN